MQRRSFLAFLASLFARQSVAVVTTEAELLAVSQTGRAFFILGGVSLTLTIASRS